MKKIFMLAFVFVLSVFLVADDMVEKEKKIIDEYDNSFCKDPKEHERWYKIVSKNKNHDNIQALHALWIGLCVKVETKEIKTNRANDIFNSAKDIILYQIEMIESEDNNVSI